jgi:hypothetical protein
MRPEKRLGNLPTVDKQKFKGGKKGNYQTVNTMKRVARQYSGHPLVRQLAVNILNHYDTKSHNHIDEARAIGEYIKTHVRYVKDPHAIEYLTEPTLMIKKMIKGEARGDCDDMACLIATLLLSIGIQPYYVIVRYKNRRGGYNHIYVAVYENNYRDKKKTRLAIDSIVKDRRIGYEVSHDLKKEIKV